MQTSAEKLEDLQASKWVRLYQQCQLELSEVVSVSGGRHQNWQTSACFSLWPDMSKLASWHLLCIL